MAGQAAVVKQLGTELHTFQIVFFRVFFGFLVLLPLVLRSAGRAFRTARLPLHLGRSALGVSTMACSFYAFTHLPLADATAYAFTMPLFMIVLAVLLLGERVRWRRWSATAIGFLGVLVMVRPGVAIEPAAFVALGGAALSALVFVMIKKLSVTDGPVTQILYFCLVGSTVSIGPALAVWQPLSGGQLSLLLAAGTLGTTGQFLAVFGWRAGEATAVAPVYYARLLFAGLLGFVFFAELPGPLTIAGAAVIVASTLYITRREAGLRRSGAPAVGDPAA